MNCLIFQCGVIECVPDSKSRDQIGKVTDISLDQYFIQKYGDQDSPAFQDVSDTDGFSSINFFGHEEFDFVNLTVGKWISLHVDLQVFVQKHLILKAFESSTFLHSTGILNCMMDSNCRIKPFMILCNWIS